MKLETKRYLKKAPWFTYPCPGVIDMYDGCCTCPPKPVRFHEEFPGPAGKNVCIICFGHMTKMVDMPIYGRNL